MGLLTAISKLKDGSDASHIMRVVQAVYLPVFERAYGAAPGFDLAAELGALDFTLDEWRIAMFSAKDGMEFLKERIAKPLEARWKQVAMLSSGAGFYDPPMRGGLTTLAAQQTVFTAGSGTAIYQPGSIVYFNPANPAQSARIGGIATNDERRDDVPILAPPSRRMFREED